MKSIIFIIFIIISFSAISSKNLRAQDIFKRSRNHPPSNPHISNRNENEYIRTVSGPPMTKKPHASSKIPKKS